MNEILHKMECKHHRNENKKMQMEVDDEDESSHDNEKVPKEAIKS